MPLPVLERARRYVGKCPRSVSGQGGHNAAYHVAATLVNGFALGTGDALSLMREWNVGCKPEWSVRELVHKVESAASAAHDRVRGHLLAPGERPVYGNSSGCAPQFSSRSVRPNPLKATMDFLDGFRCTEQDVAKASPVPMDGDWRYDGALIVQTLYQPGEQINFVTEYELTPELKARPKGRGKTIERDELVTEFEQRGTASSEAGGWLRMNPTDGKGIADANVTAFRFALLESDTLPVELQLPLFALLPLPVAAILSSGGQSYHAWVRVDANDATEYRSVVFRLLELVGRFGVDGKNKNPSRLSRLPGAKRRIGAAGDGIQRLLYLNAQPQQQKIAL